MSALVSIELKNDKVVEIKEDFDFSTLQIRKASSIDKFFYFFDSQDSSFCSVFILDDKPQVQRRVGVTLIESSNNKLLPRFEFFTWDKKAEEKKMETNNKPFKARVQLDGDASRNFWKLIGFLTTIQNIDLKEFSSFRVISSDSYISEFKNKEELDKINDLKEMFSNLDEAIISKALFNKRKDVIEEFKKMLENEKYLKEYRSNHFSEIKSPGYEAVWHHFLKNNNWLLGLNIDIKFICDFTTEVDVGVANTTGSGSPKSDIMGISDFTTLVELKTLNTNFFTDKPKNTSRANTWSFSDDFIDGISQCLGQKFDWDKNCIQKNLINNDNEILNQNLYRTVDPKTIFIIGNKQKELPFESSNGDVAKRKDTLERFRRNNRNIEIMSYDELYERAYFVVFGSKAPKLVFSENKI